MAASISDSEKGQEWQYYCFLSQGFAKKKYIKQNEAHVILQSVFVHLKLWTVLWIELYKGGSRGTRDNKSSL